MSIAVGGHTSAATNGAVTKLTTGSITTQATGSTFVIAFAWDSNAGIPTAGNAPGDNKGNTYSLITAVFQVAGSPNTSFALMESVNGTGGSGHTFNTGTFGAGLDMAIFAVEVKLGLTSGIRDQSVAWVRTTTSPFLSTATGQTVQANELALAFVFDESVSGTDTIAFGNSFTVLDTQTDANASFTGGSAFRSYSARAVVQSSSTSSGAGSTGAVPVVVTYKDKDPSADSLFFGCGTTS